MRMSLVATIVPTLVQVEVGHKCLCGASMQALFKLYYNLNSEPRMGANSSL